jgi:hypothetical protein
LCSDETYLKNFSTSNKLAKPELQLDNFSELSDKPRLGPNIEITLKNSLISSQIFRLLKLLTNISVLSFKTVLNNTARLLIS